MTEKLFDLLNRFIEEKIEFKTFDLHEENGHWDCYNIIEITDDQLDKLFDFCELLENLKAIPVYRGVDNKYLKQFYNWDIQYPKNLATSLLMLGDKGVDFSRHKLDSRIVSYEKSTIEGIFYAIHNILDKRTRSKYSCNYNVFHNYFLNSDNLTNFKESCKDLSDKDKVKVIDYYCSYIHTINGNGSEDRQSYFISTSKDYNQVKTFREKHGEGITIFGWVPDNKTPNIITYANINEHNDYVEKLGLPTYPKGDYAHQQEICLKCGMLPHYILGFQIEKTFYVNPWLFLSPRNEKVANWGMFINQAKFQEALAKSGWYYSFSKSSCSEEYDIQNRKGISQIPKSTEAER